jgi:hypothetical protein
MDDTTTTTMWINHSQLFGNPFYSPSGTAPGCKTTAGVTTCWPGRMAKIDDEWVEVVSCPLTGSPRACTVKRGQNGSTAATHALGANVSLSSDRFSTWWADETHDPTQIYDNSSWYIYINDTDPLRRGAIWRWWIEANTSTSELRQGRFDAGMIDLVSYYKNFFVLKDPPADIADTFVRPVGN